MERSRIHEYPLLLSIDFNVNEECFCRKKNSGKNSAGMENRKTAVAKKRPQRVRTPSQLAIQAAQNNPTDSSALDKYAKHEKYTPFEKYHE